MELKNMKLYILSLRQRFYRLKEWIFHFLERSTASKIQSAFKALILEKWLPLGNKASCVCFQTVQMRISQAIQFLKPSLDKILPTLFIKAKVESLLLHTVPICTVFSKSFMPHISTAVT